MKTLNKLLKENLKDLEFKKHYEGYQKEFELAKEIIKLRAEKGLTQTELAKKLNTSQSAIARIENGKHKNITLAFLDKLSHALGTTIEIHFKKQPQNV